MTDRAPDHLDELGLIASYSRSQAIADGVLIDASREATDLGIRCPVALTRAAWSETVFVPAGLIGQDAAGRLHDVLWMLCCALRRSIPIRYLDENSFLYGVHVRKNNRPGTPPVVYLKVMAGPDDDGSPCFTISLPAED